MGPYNLPPDSTDITVNVPANTSPGVVNDILNNLPSIFTALGGIFGIQQQNQQQVQPVRQDLTPVYLLGGAILLILLTKK